MAALVPDPPPAPVVAEPVVPATPASPWAADAAAYFGEDAAAAANFDRYMREKQQPYITQLEASTKDAKELWDDLNSDPATAARDIIASVYREQPEIVAAFDGIFTPAEPVVEPPVVAPAPDDIPEWAKPLVESHQQKVDRELAETEASNYSTFKDGLKTSHDLTDDDIGLIDPFIFGSPSDADAAVAAYRAWQQKAGITPAPVPVPPAPPVLGGGSVGAVPPLATQYKSWSDVGPALKNFLAREGATATPPPVVG